MRVAVATDHAGLPLKGPIVDWLTAAGHEVVDFGVNDPAPIDYPDIIAPAARAVAAGECQMGIVLGGSGTGEQIVANKVRGIGRWSAEWFLARTLGRPRVVAGDLGVRKAVGRLYGAPATPSELEVRRLTAHWGAAATHAQALCLHDLAERP